MGRDDLVCDGVHGHVGIRGDINGRCFYATRVFEAGTVVAKFEARGRTAIPTYLTLQVSSDQHILLAPEELQYINHSCEPNVFFDTVRSVIVTLRPVSAGDEICFFYPSTEWYMDRPFACRCSRRGCIGTVRGASDVAPEILRRYRLAPHIEQLLHDASRSPSGAPAASRVG